MTLAQDGTRDTQTPTWEVGLVTGRTKLPGPDLLLRELERAAEKLEGDLQALEKERPEVRSHHCRRILMLTQGGAWLSAVLSYLSGNWHALIFIAPLATKFLFWSFFSKFLREC